MSDDVKLPEPSVWCRDTGSYSASQLRAYGEACRRDEREKCIQALKETRIVDFSMPEQWFNNGVDAAVSAIQARPTP